MSKTLWTLVVALACVATALQSRAALRYVNINSTNATPPYTNWATAATVIQDAVDVAARERRGMTFGNPRQHRKEP